jgi:hypothetical protein
MKNLFITISILLYFNASLFAQIGWVGNMFPTTGNTTQGTDFTVYVQVWKDGVTNGGGQGPGITCQIYYGKVSSFGGSWNNISQVPMSYNIDIGNNDEYLGVLNLNQGLYEYTCRCSDNGGGTWMYQSAGNGQLTVNAPLPVKWEDFSVKKEKTGTILQWEVYDIHNHAYFEIQHSLDAVNYKTIGKNFNIQGQYKFNHNHPINGINYYRIKQVDIDGISSYSNVNEIQWDQVQNALPRYNLATNQLSLDQTSILAFEIIGLDGKSVIHKTNFIGSNVDCSLLPNGTYTFRYLINNDWKSYRFVKF